MCVYLLAPQQACGLMADTLQILNKCLLDVLVSISFKTEQNSPSQGDNLSPFFFKKKKFIFGCAGSSLLQAFSICGEWGLLFLVLYGLTIPVALTGRWA